MRIIDDLHYNASSQRLERQTRWDETHFTVSRQQDEKHKIKWYMDATTCEEAVLLARKGSGFNRQFNELFCINTSDDDISLLEKKFQGYASIVTDRMMDIDSEFLNIYRGK